MKDIKGKIQTDTPYEKVMQDQLFRNAIDACRKKRADKPNEFPNDVWALKGILLPKERKKIEDYLTDYKPHTEELQDMENELQHIDNIIIKNRIRLYRKRDLSFHLFNKELERQYKDGQLEDMNFDNNINKQDLVIRLYEGLLEIIIDVLVEGGWIATGRLFEVGHD